MSDSVAQRLGLVVLLDPGAAVADFTWTVDAVFESKPPAVQLRAKGASAQELEELARGIAPKARAAGALFFVNDRPDVAIAVGANGVHVGPCDVPVSRLRDRVPDRFLVGASTDNPEEAQRLELAGADYIGCGTVYPTASKPDAGNVIGVSGVSAVVDAVGIPVVGIGGITPERAAEVLSSGCRGIAVLGAVMAARSPSEVVAALMEVVESRQAGRP